MNKFEIENGTFEIDVDEHLRPSLERELTGTTKMDTEIQSLPIPQKPISIKVAVLILRMYRKFRPTIIGNRCVFEPSCSHYSELVIREGGLIKGISLTIKRLFRCRSGAGGLDFSYQKDKSCNIE